MPKKSERSGDWKPTTIGERLRTQLFEESYQSSLVEQYNDNVVRAGQIIDDISPRPGHWYCIVVKPYDKQYAAKKPWFESPKFLDACLKRYRTSDVNACIATVEKTASKHHVNLLVHTDNNLEFIHHNMSWDGIGMVYCQQPVYTASCFMRYIFKESLRRPFIRFKDYSIFSRQPVGTVPNATLERMGESPTLEATVPAGESSPGGV